MRLEVINGVKKGPRESRSKHPLKGGFQRGSNRKQVASASAGSAMRWQSRHWASGGACNCRRREDASTQNSLSSLQDRNHGATTFQYGAQWLVKAWQHVYGIHWAQWRQRSETCEDGPDMACTEEAKTRCGLRRTEFPEPHPAHWRQALQPHGDRKGERPRSSPHLQAAHRPPPWRFGKRGTHPHLPWGHLAAADAHH